MINIIIQLNFGQDIIFMFTNTNYISKHNNENYTMGINRYTDMSRVEFRDIYSKNTMKPHSKVVTR